MTYNKTVDCNNCGQQIYWNKENPADRRPYDVETGEYHKCSGFTQSYKGQYKPEAAPKPRMCKNGCGIEIIYDPKEGYFREGSITGKKHFPCPAFNKGEQKTLTTVAANQNIETVGAPKYTSNPSNHLDILKANIEGLTPKHFDFTDMQTTLKEIALILQGIAAQQKIIIDNQEVANKYHRVTAAVLNEWKEEMKEMNRLPKVEFEDGTTTTSKDEPDIYDELADTDDRTDTDEDLRGFRPSDAGTSGVRSDL